MPNINLPPTLPEVTPSYPELPPESSGPWLAQNRKSVILGGTAVLLALVIGATSLVQRFSHKTATTNSNLNQAITNNSTNPTTNTPKRNTFHRYEATVIPDQDRDGLADSEEIKLGTKFDAVDTDGDNLSDYDEVKVYGTDPKKQDTDGDGKTDGQEVAAGTNPNGPGPLLNLNQAIKELNNTNQ